MAESGVKHAVLGNGLELLGELNPKNKSAAVGFFVKTGARDEVGKESGVSHFLEHMMFKGTPKRDALQLTYDLGNIGAQANAFTTEEMTVYYAAIVPEYFSEMQEILCDMLRPSIDPQEFSTEKKVILEEIALYQDRPHYYLFENALRDYFGAHPAGNSVLGSSDSIAALQRDEMYDYFKRRYAPSNMVLAASGNFDWDRFVADAKKYCETWQDFKAARTVNRHPAAAIKREYRKKNINQAHVLFIGDGPSAQDEERYATSVLACILGDSVGSRLYWELLDKGLADSAGADSDEKDGAGCFMAYASTEPQRLEQVSKIVARILDTAQEFSEEDIKRARTKIISRIVLGGELPMGKLMSLGTEYLYNGQMYDLRKVIAKIKSVDRAAVEQALQRYKFKTWSEFRLVPESA